MKFPIKFFRYFFTNLGFFVVISALQSTIKSLSSFPAETINLLTAESVTSDFTRAIGNRALAVGIQNIWTEDAGAYTGEISAKMARDIGACWALIGHSERRQLQKESDELVKQKLECSLKAGMNVIVCVGETLEERLSGQAESVVSEQLKKVLAIDLTKIQNEVVIAYEPIWAIGTGLTPEVNDCL